jgi:hypothetical protein
MICRLPNVVEQTIKPNGLVQTSVAEFSNLDVFADLHKVNKKV